MPSVRFSHRRWCSLAGLSPSARPYLHDDDGDQASKALRASAASAARAGRVTRAQNYALSPLPSAVQVHTPGSVPSQDLLAMTPAQRIPDAPTG
mmetsp:Transcript_72/g.212  ORF Transcript_72/g.212 Transcript_72/m.212 type:complete len:94 (+) Transcript_72:158-439(+)